MEKNTNRRKIIYCKRTGKSEKSEYSVCFFRFVTKKTVFYSNKRNWLNPSTIFHSMNKRLKELKILKPLHQKSKHQPWRKSSVCVKKLLHPFLKNSKKIQLEVCQYNDKRLTPQRKKKMLLKSPIFLQKIRKN